MKLLDHVRRHPLKTAIVGLALAALGWWVYLHSGEFTKEAIIAVGKQLPAAWFVAGLLILPLAGFPLSVLLLLSGIRFGFAGGMTLSTVAVYFHNFAAYRLTHGLFRSRLRAFLERSGYVIPSISARHQLRFTLLFAAIHGPPYVAKLYLLALTDIPFRTYFLAGSAVYAIFCAVPVAAGSAVATLDLTWIYVVIGAIAGVSLLGYWLRNRTGVSVE